MKARPSDAGGSDTIQRARRHFTERAWADAHEAFSASERAAPLEAEDLERFATAAYMIGKDDAYLDALERAYHARQTSQEGGPAARCAFWIGLRLLFRGETARANGWFARARRLVEREGADCVEHGYLLIPVVEEHLDAGDAEAAYDAAARAAEIAEQCNDVDLVACARHQQGKARVQQGRVAAGLALLDEAMVAAAAGELSPIMTGLIYCAVIEACQRVYAVSRAREWTSALAQWCERQPQIVAFIGACQVHRAEILQMQGAWRDAAEEARRACERCMHVNRAALAHAAYQLGEVHRLRGEFAEAEAAYRSASASGFEPQPGMALMRLAQGRSVDALAAIRRAVGEISEPLQRTRLLPAYVEIALEAEEMQDARTASAELDAAAQTFQASALHAMAAHARGAIELAQGEAQVALRSLREAAEEWRRTEAPHAVARARMLAGLACRALGDEDGAKLELDAARLIFEELGAAPDLVRLDLVTANDTRSSRLLSPRELEVLRLVADGKTNKAIAAQLSLSEKTIDRHVSNIFGKIDVSSRAAATAYAYRNKLI
jgi:DNA-binding CsgD family transcriptional regulator